ncbi:MAG: PmoA family protein [Salinibacter sp.]
MLSTRPFVVGGLAALLIGLVLVPGPAGAQSSDPTYEVTVAAGALDRRGTVVSFALPSALPAAAYHLEGPDGTPVPLQVGETRAWFVLDRLAAGQERTYQVMEGDVAAAGVGLARQKRSITLSAGDQPVLRYWTDERPLPRPELDSIYLRGGYLHPVRTPSGRVVTGDYAEGHPHHHGVWSAWTNTEFRGRTPDFWNMQRGTGAVVPMALDSTWQGPVQAGLTARHRYVDRSAPEPTTALYEEWTVRVYDVPGADESYRLFDLTVTQTTASSSPLVLPPYHYGGVAVRGRDAWYGPGNAHFLTSAGRTRSDGNETRARWTYIGGEVEGRRAGIAMLSHPGNLRAPQPVRIHPEMPYFCFAPSQLGRWAIEPGRPHVARYRFVVFDGPPDAARLDRLWADYAYPPTVTVSRASSGADS